MKNLIVLLVLFVGIHFSAQRPTRDVLPLNKNYPTTDSNIEIDIVLSDRIITIDSFLDEQIL